MAALLSLSSVAPRLLEPAATSVGFEPVALAGKVALGEASLSAFLANVVETAMGASDDRSTIFSFPVRPTCLTPSWLTSVRRVDAGGSPPAASKRRVVGGVGRGDGGRGG